MTTMTKRVTRALVATAIVVALGACQGGSAVDGAEVKAGKFQLTTDILAGTDVARMNVTATRVDCATGVPVVPAVERHRSRGHVSSGRKYGARWQALRS
jgi:hypothetical protein